MKITSTKKVLLTLGGIAALTKPATTNQLDTTLTNNKNDYSIKQNTILTNTQLTPHSNNTNELKGNISGLLSNRRNTMNTEMSKSTLHNKDLNLFTNNKIDLKVMDKFLSSDFLKGLDARAKRDTFYIASNIISTAALKEFDYNSRRMRVHNDNTAKEMISKNKNTEFGKQHNFDKILKSRNPIEEFKKQVPISDYWDYEKQINRMAAGEKNVLTAEDPTFFALSSGTTGKNKLIPSNKSSSLQTFKGVMLLNGMISRIIPGGGSNNLGITLMRMSDNEYKTSGGIPMGDASSGGIKKMSWMMPLLYTTPVEGLTISDKPTANYIHSTFGLMDKNLKHITATFSPYVIQLIKNMEQRNSDLVNTIRTGKLPNDLKLTPEKKSELEKLIKPNPKRADELQIEFSKGFNNIIPRIWPNFKYIGAVTTGSFDVYIPELRKYAGKTPIYNGTFGASEGWMGISHSAKKPTEFALMPGASYYEFIPVEDMEKEHPKAVDIKDLKPNKEYEVVITTHSGFYRYRVGDIVKVKGFEHENPVIEFSYRRGSILNIFGEKVTEKQTNDALKNFSNRLLKANEKLVDYTTIADTDRGSEPPRYKFFIELKTNTPLNDSKSKNNAIDILEQELAKSSYDYGDMRTHKQLDRMDICFVKPGAFERLTETMRTLGEVSLSNQIKIPRVLKNKKLVKQLENEAL